MSGGRRILILVSFVNLAGAQIAALRLARGLRDRGHDPRVVFLYTVVPIPNPDHPYEVLRNTRPGAAGYLSLVGAVARLVQQERPAVVLTFMPLASVLGQAAAAIGRARRRVISHRVPVATIRPIWRALDMMWAWLGVYTDVVAVSDGVRQGCTGYPAWLRRHMVVVHNGLFGWQPSRLDRQAARTLFGVPDGALALAAVGRLAPQKNYPLLLRVLQHIDNVQLLIAGEGPEREALERLARQLDVNAKVRFLGSLSRDAVPDLLAATDVFVQSSTFEGQSNALLEALQAGLPVVAHDVPEQRETVADDNGATAGSLVPLNDVDAWVAAIERLRNDPITISTARAVAARRAQLFRFDKMVSGFERVLTTPR
jgi:glycosyltransferase involved in cell wall biosynthesis